MRAGEDEAAHARVLIHHPLEVGEQIRGPLDLIQDGALGEAGQKGPWVRLGEAARIGAFQRDIRLVGKSGAGR